MGYRPNTCDRVVLGSQAVKLGGVLIWRDVVRDTQTFLFTDQIVTNSTVSIVIRWDSAGSSIEYSWNGVVAHHG